MLIKVIIKKLNQCESTLKSIVDKEIGEKSMPFFFKGMALLNLNRYEEAIECFDKIISLNPQNAEAFSSKGKCLQYLGRLPEAIKSFENAISLNPKNSEYSELKEQVSQKLSFKQGKDHHID